MADLIEPSDLKPFIDVEDDKAEAMIADALAMAKRVAPCLDDDEFEAKDAAKAILRAAIIRWDTSGAGTLQQDMVTAGTFTQQHTVDNRVTRNGMFTPSEITQLQQLCEDSDGEALFGAFTIDTTPNSWDRDDYPAARFGGRWARC